MNTGLIEQLERKGATDLELTAAQELRRAAINERGLRNTHGIIRTILGLPAESPNGGGDLQSALTDFIVTEKHTAYEAGWRTAAGWMDRDDLVADIGSPAYLAYRDAALRPNVEVSGLRGFSRRSARLPGSVSALELTAQRFLIDLEDLLGIRTEFGRNSAH